ncbi:hypothetical protein ABW717_001083 [Escherichia coli]
MRRPHHDSTTGDIAAIASAETRLYYRSNASAETRLHYYGNTTCWKGREPDQQ